MPITTNTKDPQAVFEHLRLTFVAACPGASLDFLDHLMRLVDEAFAGRYLDYAPNDLKYHDYEHTLQASACFADILAGRHAALPAERFSDRQSELGLAAILLHDTGYLRLRSDTEGTGAKYTYAHVLRSCSFAASLLPVVGVSGDELDIVLGAIRSTGPSSDIKKISFNNDSERLISCMVVTADYLAQMAAADYPGELDFLYREFEESDDFLHVPPEKRMFKSAADLKRRTPGFWEHFVKPKLTGDYQSVYRFLEQPDGSNPYLEAIDHNLKIIAQHADD